MQKMFALMLQLQKNQAVDMYSTTNLAPPYNWKP